jgi:ribose 5-phosphate isomerase RpiB
MTIAIGCDHAGVELKKEVLSLLNELHIEFADYGTDTSESILARRYPRQSPPGKSKGAY